MVHVLFIREHSIDESSGIRKDAHTFEIAFERTSGITYDQIIEERALDMKDHPAHGPTNRYLPKKNKLQR